jgi:hypothetical protein
MSDWMTPALFALCLWWFATGAILYLDGLPPRTFRHSMLGATVLLVAALFSLNHSAAQQSTAMAYCSFTSALIVWGWLEMSFLMGFITGSRKHGCAEGCSGPAHFWHATEAILHHELSILVCAIVIVSDHLGRPQPDRHLDLHAAVGNAAERQAQPAPGCAQFQRGIPAASPDLSEKLLPSPAHEPAVSAFGHGRQHRHDTAGPARDGIGKQRSGNGCLHAARNDVGTRRHRTLVHGAAAAVQRAVEVGAQVAGQTRRPGTHACTTAVHTRHLVPAEIIKPQDA